jgi:hypothetical protein
MRKEREKATSTIIKIATHKYSVYTVNCTNEDMISDKIQ